MVVPQERLAVVGEGVVHASPAPVPVVLQRGVRLERDVRRGPDRFDCVALSWLRYALSAETS